MPALHKYPSMQGLFSSHTDGLGSSGPSEELSSEQAPANARAVIMRLSKPYFDGFFMGELLNKMTQRMPLHNHGTTSAEPYKNFALYCDKRSNSTAVAGFWISMFRFMP